MNHFRTLAVALGLVVVGCGQEPPAEKPLPVNDPADMTIGDMHFRFDNEENELVMWPDDGLPIFGMLHVDLWDREPIDVTIIEVVSSGEMIFKVMGDGSVELGEGVTLDEGAAAFWATVDKLGQSYELYRVGPAFHAPTPEPQP